MADSPEDDRPALLIKLHERREHHKARGRIYRAGIVVVGCFLVLAGIVMSGPGVPGPGIATILLGLFFLALEFERAERWLARAIDWAERAKERAENSTPLERGLSAAVLLLCFGSLVTAVLVWDVPVLPV